jgi:hypothetical protein
MNVFASGKPLASCLRYMDFQFAVHVDLAVTRIFSVSEAHERNAVCL